MIPQHSGGGADGSIMIFKNIELQNDANTNLSDIIGALENTLSQHRSRNTGVDVSPGDMWVLIHAACRNHAVLIRLFLQHPTCCCRRHR